MAVAAHPRRRHRQHPDPDGRGGDRLRRGIRRAGPAQSRQRRREFPRPRRGDAGEIARAAEQRPHLRRRHQGLARGAGRIRRPGRSLRPRQGFARHRLCDAGRGSRQLHLQARRAVAQCEGAGRRCGRARTVHHRARTRRHRAPRADDHGRTGRPHAVPELRDPADSRRLRHHHDQGRQGRHRQHHPAGLAAQGADRQPGAVLDSLCPQRSLDLCLRRRRARRQGAGGHDREKTGADRHLRHRHERHQDHAGLEGDAGRRDSRPGAGERADRLVAVAAGQRHDLRIPRRVDRGSAGDRLCAEPRPHRRCSASARCLRPRWSAPPGISTSTTAC